MKYQIYHETLGSAIQEAGRFVQRKQIESKEFDDHLWGAVGYGETGRGSFIIDSIKGKGTRKGLQVQAYRLDSGRYELNIYVL
jgi:hypothetical protein